jgi:hypothetical protein
MSGVRIELGLTLRDVVTQSAQIAANQRNQRFQFSLRKLSEMEKHSKPPTIHQACTLALLYGVPIGQVLSWYLGPVVEQANTATPQHGPAGATGPNQSEMATELQEQDSTRI